MSLFKFCLLPLICYYNTIICFSAIVCCYETGSMANCWFLTLKCLNYCSHASFKLTDNHLHSDPKKWPLTAACFAFSPSFFFGFLVEDTLSNNSIAI